MNIMKFRIMIYQNANVNNQEQLDLIYFYIMIVNEIQIYLINKNKIIINL